MKKNYCHIHAVVDSSGSMKPLAEETISGFNEFIEEQKKIAGECSVSLIQFDDRYEENYHLVDINEVKPLDKETYRPRGWTKLYDSMGKSINSLGEKLNAMPENERPDKILFVCLSDGEDTSSKEFTQSQIRDMVKHQTEKYNWEFVYLGANQNAILEGAKFGLVSGQSMTYAHNPIGTISAFRSLSKNTASYRLGMKANMVFEKEDIDAQKSAGA